MSGITGKTNIKMAMTLEYSHNGVQHCDHYYCPTVNMWRDVFSPEITGALMGQVEGDKVVLHDGYYVAPFDDRLQYSLSPVSWQPPKELSRIPSPRNGRWYPQGYLRGVPNVFPQTKKPLLIRSATDTHLDVDCNHPLAGIPLKIVAEIFETSDREKERGGRCNDWLEEVTGNGPGIQLIRENIIPDYHEDDAVNREDNTKDSEFYKTPRLVDHIDSQARQHLQSTVRRFLQPEMKILDLMSSIQSHLPSGFYATGLGMNETEMRANPQLTEIMIHDLNSNPQVPLPTASFDCVCCHLSIEYLLYPEKVMAEISRMLRPGGICIISFSNRWFPPKVTTLWQTLHEFERPRYVLSLMGNGFRDFTTTSFRNWPRPDDDTHAHLYYYSDPLHIVTGIKE